MGDYKNYTAGLEHAASKYEYITIEKAVKDMVGDSGDDQNTVITTLTKILLNDNFRLIYDECIEMIPNQKSVHVECRMRELGIIEFLLQVDEKGWDNVYIDHKKIHIWLVTRERDNKGKILLLREKFIKKDPKTGKEKIIYSKAVREDKVAQKEYTGEPILFKKSKARRNEFVKFLAENNISDPWAFNELPGKQKDTKTQKNRKNKYTPRGGALGRLMLSLAKAFANNRNGELIGSAEMLALLNKNGATVKRSDKEYVKLTDKITRKLIISSKSAFEGRLTRIRNHIKENYPT